MIAFFFFDCHLKLQGMTHHDPSAALDEHMQTEEGQPMSDADSDCSWYIGVQAKGFLFEIDNLDFGQHGAARASESFSICGS